MPVWEFKCLVVVGAIIAWLLLWGAADYALGKLWSSWREEDWE